MTIGERIRNRRKELKLTQTAVVQATNISSGNLSELENNKYNPSLQTLVLLRTVLKCSLDWLVTGEEYQRQPLKSEQTITRHETSLLSVYTALSDEQQTAVQDFMLYQLQKGQQTRPDFGLNDADGTA